MLTKLISSFCQQVKLHFPALQAVEEGHTIEFWPVKCGLKGYWPKSPARSSTFILFVLWSSGHQRSSCTLKEIMVQSNGERILHSWEERKACSLRALLYEKQGVDAPKMGKSLGLCLVLPCLVCQWMLLSLHMAHSGNVLAQETFMVNRTRKIIIRQTTSQRRK